MRLAFFGDVIGRPGRDALAHHLPAPKAPPGSSTSSWSSTPRTLAAGFGVTEDTAEELFEVGADCLTLGNHAWDQREALTYIEREPPPAAAAQLSAPCPMRRARG